MTRCQRIYADLEYDRSTRENEDITDALLDTLVDEESVKSFASNPSGNDSFADTIQWQLSQYADDAYSYTPVQSWDFQKALLEATKGQFGTELLTMWHGWKSFMESPEEQLRQLEAEASKYANEIDAYIGAFEPERRAVYIRLLITKMLKWPGAIEQLPQAITDAEVSGIDGMKALRMIPATS